MAYRTLLLLTAVIVLGGACSRGDATDSGPAAASAPRQEAAPEGWDRTRLEVIRLFQERKYSESTALLEQFVAAYPDYSQGHYQLAENHELLGWMDGTGLPPAARRDHLETAVRHFRRARELAADPLDREQATKMLVLTLGEGRLNRLEEALSYARENAGAQPSAANYGYLASVLRAQGKPAEGADVLMDARERLSEYERDYQLAHAIVDHIEHSAGLSRDTTETLLEMVQAGAGRLMASDAVARYDNFTFLDANTLRGAGMLLQSQALRLRVDRLVTNPAETRTLLAEADRLHKEGLVLVNKDSAQQ